MQSEAPRQFNAAILRKTAQAILLCLFATGASAQDFVAAGPTKIRLIDAGVQDGARYALVEIALGEAVTYWRNPGDSGVAPLFDFAGSQNLGEADALYPQPRAIDEAGAKIFGYRGEATFPIRVAAADPSQPIHLALALDYAACDQICRPIHATLEADLATQPPPPNPVLAAILAKIPKPLDAPQAAQAAKIEFLDVRDQKPRWRLIPQRPAEQIFVEAPDGFYIESEKSGDGFILTLAEHPAKKSAPPTPLRITLSGPAPVEFDLLLPPAKP